jgi:uncharacterized membrane protein YbhN (UPF0104 family)
MKRPIQILITIAVLSLSFIYLYLNRAELQILQGVRLTNVGILAFSLFLFFFLTGYTFRLLVGLMNVKLSVMETIGLSILTNFGNYLGPTRPGAALKAVYLKSSKGLAYARFTSILAANTFLAFFMCGIVGVILLFLLRELEKADIPTALLLICVSLIIGSAIPFIYKSPNLKEKGKFRKLLQSTLRGFEIIRAQKAKLGLICFTFFAQFLLSAVIYVAAFTCLGISITFLTAMVIGVFTSIANLFTITPNNLGIQEAVSAYLFTISGFDFTTGVIGAGLVRVVHMTITFALTPIFVHYLLQYEDLKLSKVFSWLRVKGDSW